MNARDVIRNTIDMGHEILTAYVGDLEDGDLLLRVTPGTNHIAWQMGHLIASEHEMMTNVGFSMPDLPGGFVEAHGKEAATSDDPSKFLKKQEYLDLMAQQRAGTLAALDGVSDDDLDQASPEAMQSYAPTVGSALNMIGVHEMMHAAQFVGIRRMRGKPVLI